MGAGEGWPLIHFDGAMVMDGKLYAPHSNYPAWPMTSSLEIFDADTLQHVGTHSFGINWGSLTWVDFHDGYWWMVFANYDQPYGPDKSKSQATSSTPSYNQFTTNFQMVEAWTLPRSIIDKFDVMSNSGGSVGPRRVPLPDRARISPNSTR